MASAIPMPRTGIPEEPEEGVLSGLSVGKAVGPSVGTGTAGDNGVVVGVGTGGESPCPGVGSGLSTNSSPPAGRRSRE
jgi:hypothetical protein